MKNRALTIIKYTIIILAVGICYGIVAMRLGYGIPCPVHLLTGFQCPGCGISRMCIALLKLDFVTAYKSNQVLFLMTPGLLIIFGKQIYKYIKYGNFPASKVTNILLWIMVVILMLWGIVRNII